MIRLLIYILALLLSGCLNNDSLSVTDTNVSRSTDYQAEIQELLEIDKQNKLREEVYLREIAIAQENDDQEAYKFYFGEYINVPRIPLEPWMEAEPGFYPRKSAKQVVKEYKREGN